jgi:hypothetical protein
MNTEPPVDDELARMLVSMKQNVLEHAAPRRPRRARRVGVVIAIVALVGLGTASGAVALGMVPNPVVVAAPTATSAPSRTPSTPASAPFTPTATPTPTRRPYDRTDPGTWTISGDEVGPVALGAPYTGEIDDLSDAYTRDPNTNCSNPDVSFWDRPGAPTLVVTEQDGLVAGVQVGLGPSSDPSNLEVSPTTAEGIGVGSTLDDLHARYPDLRNVGDIDGFELWSVQRNGYAITFQIDTDTARVRTVWDGSDPMPPYEFCG